MTDRLFFALWPDERQRRALTRVWEELSDHPGHKTHPEDLHLTLVFLGDLDAEGHACAEVVAGRVRGLPFVLYLDHLDAFPRARVLWCGVLERPQPLMDLRQTLDKGLRDCGFHPERHTFEPHVTLVCKARSVPVREIRPPIVWPVSDFVLVSARPGQYPRYRVEHRWPLIPYGIMGVLKNSLGILRGAKSKCDLDSAPFFKSRSESLVFSLLPFFKHLCA